MKTKQHAALGLVLFASLGALPGCATETSDESGGGDAVVQRGEIRLSGVLPGDLAGAAVRRAGDVNGDGRVDLLVAAPGESEGPASRVYVVTGPLVADARLDEIGGFTILPEGEVETVATVAGVGDVNGDGLDDVLVNAVRRYPAFDGCYHDCPPLPEYDGPLRAYVVFGRTDGADVRLADIVGGRGGGFVIDGERREDMQYIQVVSLGDLDGDGRADFALAAPDAPSATTFDGLGRVYVVFGRTATTPLQLGAVGATERGFVIESDSASTFARSIARAGDVNGDGLDDLVLGNDTVVDTGAEQTHGRAYVVLGKGSTEPVLAADLRAGRFGFVIEGEAPPGEEACCPGFGLVVEGGGDVDGDGLDDIVVSAPFFEADGSLPEGRVYVVFGRTETSPVRAEEIARGNGGFAVTGGSEIGLTLASLEDHTGDDRADLLTSDYDGAVLLYSAAEPGRGEAVTPRTEGTWYLSEGSSVGDLNGNGRSDLALVDPKREQDAPGEVLIVLR